MGREEVERQRERIKSILVKIIDMAGEVNAEMQNVKPRGGVSHRALDSKGRGFILYYPSSGFAGEYQDPNGRRYTIEVRERLDTQD